MESKLKLPACSLHPGEVVSKATLDPEATKVLFCDKCILFNKPQSTVLSVQDYLAQFLQLNKSLPNFVVPSTTKGGIPKEIQVLLLEESEILSRLSVRVETERSKVVAHYESLLEQILKIIEDKQKEALAKLDSQLQILENNFILLRNESDFAFNGAKIAPFESLDEAIMKVNKLISERELTIFIQNLNFQIKQKSDMKNAGSQNIESHIAELQRAVLQKAEVMKPLMNVKQLPSIQLADKAKWDAGVKLILENLSKSLNDLNTVSNTISSIQLPYLAAHSKIVSTAEEEKLIAEAICKSGKVNYELLYRGSRDGYHYKDFKRHCEGKGPLLLVIESTTGSRFGAYTENIFQGQMQYQMTNKFTFLFSFDRKEIYTVGGIEFLVSNEKGVSFGGADLVISSKRCDIDKSYSAQRNFFCNNKVLDPAPNGSTRALNNWMKNPGPFLNMDSHAFLIKEIEGYIATSDSNDLSDTRLTHITKIEGLQAFSRSVGSLADSMLLSQPDPSNQGGLLNQLNPENQNATE